MRKLFFLACSLFLPASLNAQSCSGNAESLFSLAQPHVLERPSAMSFIEPALSRRIIQLSAPVMLAMLSQTLINQVDHILVGHLPLAEATERARGHLVYALVTVICESGSIARLNRSISLLMASSIGVLMLPFSLYPRTCMLGWFVRRYASR